MNRPLTIATRRGELALAQTRLVVEMLKAGRPGLEVRVHEMTSAGDADRSTALWNLKDTGFFTSFLEQALLAGEADVAVHSFKDLPTGQREGLAVTAICDRHWPEDCLLARTPVASIYELPASARIGTSSLRRAAQLRHLRPDLQVIPLRGNVQTRIRKLHTPEFDAIVLARAGLERLGLTDAFISDVQGRNMIRRFIEGPTSQAGTLGDRVAVELLEAGGRKILDELEREQARGDVRD